MRPSLPDVVTSERLRLPLVTPEDAAGMIAGRRRKSWHRDYPRKDDQDAATMVKADDPDATWGPRHIVRGFDGLVVGSIGFFGGPLPGPDEEPEVEVGFGLVEEARGNGAVREALGALLEETDRAGVRVRASVLPDNRASLRTLAVCGFTQLRGSTEDGELVMVRPLCPDPPVAAVASVARWVCWQGVRAKAGWRPVERRQRSQRARMVRRSRRRPVDPGLGDLPQTDVQSMTCPLLRPSGRMTRSKLPRSSPRGQIRTHRGTLPRSVTRHPGPPGPWPHERCSRR